MRAEKKVETDQELFIYLMLQLRFTGDLFLKLVTFACDCYSYPNF